MVLPALAGRSIASRIGSTFLGTPARAATTGFVGGSAVDVTLPGQEAVATGLDLTKIAIYGIGTLLGVLIIVEVTD